MNNLESSVSGKLIVHTINLDIDLPLGTEFETFALYGLSKSQYDAIKRPGAMSLPLLKFFLAAVVGLLLPDFLNLYQSSSLDLTPLADKLGFVFAILAVTSVCELARMIFCHWYPITEKQKAWAAISKHFNMHQGKKTRSR